MKAMEWFFIVIGILCVIYGIMVARIGSGTGFFLVWICAGIMMVGACALIHTGICSRLPVFITISIKTIAIVLFILLITVECVILSGFTYKAEDGLDYIIVLGAQVRDDGPSVVLKYRLDQACKYLSDNKETVCVVSGGKGSNKPCTEAEAMEEYLVGKGIDPSRIIREDKSHNTLENMKFSKELIHDRSASAGIVTNNFHVFRT